MLCLKMACMDQVMWMVTGCVHAAGVQFDN